MNILGVSRKYRLINRVRVVLRVLIKHGLGYFIDRIFREPSLRILRFNRSSISRDGKYFTPAQRLRFVLEELGPTYVKIGQFFSTRADILPENFLNELSKLQDNVSPFPFEEVRKIIVEDLGKDINEIFLQFSEKPIFSASIGQVHSAILISGQQCVVKVRRPGVEQTISDDVKVLTEISKLASKHIPELKQWNISGLLEEVGEHLKRQIDFIYEAGMMEKLKGFYEKAGIKVPDVFWDYTSKRILTMEQIIGIKISDVPAKRPDLSQHIVKGIFETLFKTGYFHADLHPGNILVTDKGDLAFVDFGLVGYFSFEKRKLLAGIVSGILKGNIADVLPHIRKLFGLSYRVPENFERDVGFIVDKYGSLPLKNVHLADIFYDLMRMARKMNIRLDPDVGLLAKNIMNLEAICTRLNPYGSMFDLSKTYWQSTMDRGIFQHMWLEEIKNVITSYRDVILELPETWEDLIRINRERVEIEQKIANRLDNYTRSLDHAGAKISFAIIVMPILTIFIILGIQNLSAGVFIFLAVGLIILFTILFRMITGRYNE